MWIILGLPNQVELFYTELKKISRYFKIKLINIDQHMTLTEKVTCHCDKNKEQVVGP
jgi:hypothetical protein